MVQKIGILSIVIILIMATGTTSSITPSYAQKEITLRALLDNLADPGRWDSLIQPALQELRARHPDENINIKYEEFPYNQTRNSILTAMSNQTPIDLVSVDQIWLGEFAEKGFLTNLTNYTKTWGRGNDWYEANWDGGFYNDTVYGIWAWTDIRGLWYWKDMLHTAGVDPNSLRTWDGYIDGAKKLNTMLRPEGIDGMYLVAASHSPDMWYPYLWMLGENIIGQKSGHPTKGNYWFPTYNSSQGVRALEFLREQVINGIKPQEDALHQAQDFVNRKFAVSLDGSWVPGEFPPEEQKHLEEKVGFLPMFPLSNETNYNATLMGGWELSIPTTSRNKDLAWELITIMLEPKFLSPWISKFGYLPTQSVIGEAFRANSSFSSFPYYDEMIGMIPSGYVRPSIPEYSLIAQDIHEAINRVVFEGKDVNQALQEAAFKSAKSLGW
ncbi:MAG TPA: extracellular solute-binding protein [Nitrososphaeraceae archaeon]|nr:extracellular solute-binding protein [Nitrososphaeraceae archaeon]